MTMSGPNGIAQWCFCFLLFLNIALIFYMCIYFYNPNHSKAIFTLEKSPRLESYKGVLSTTQVSVSAYEKQNHSIEV